MGLWSPQGASGSGGLQHSLPAARRPPFPAFRPYPYLRRSSGWRQEASGLGSEAFREGPHPLSTSRRHPPPNQVPHAPPDHAQNHHQDEDQGEGQVECVQAQGDAEDQAPSGGDSVERPPDLIAVSLFHPEKRILPPKVPRTPECSGIGSCWSIGFVPGLR